MVVRNNEVGDGVVEALLMDDNLCRSRSICFRGLGVTLEGGNSARHSCSLTVSLVD